MKKLLLGSAAMLLTATLFAQPEQPFDGPPKPPPVTERWKYDSTKLQLYVVLNNAQMSNVKSTFFSFYNEMDALMQQNKKAPPASPAREEIEKIRTKRNAALKAILDGQQFMRFDVFEKEFMPPPHPHNPPKEKEGAENV